MVFRWIDWNVDHIARHGVEAGDAEYVVSHAESPYPKERDEEKWLVMGQDPGGRYLQVIYLLDEGGTVFVIHSRPLTDREKRNFRRLRR